MRKAFLVLMLRKETGGLHDAHVVSEWPLTEFRVMPFANVLLMEASGSTFESARARVLRHATVRHPWVMRFVSDRAPLATPPTLQSKGVPRASARRRRRLRVVVDHPRVIDGRKV